MARSDKGQNGKLEEALTILAQSHETMRQTLAAVQQTQATMVQTQAAFVAQMAEMRADADRRWLQTVERFARIEAILLEHSRILHALPDAVRDKIGFKSSPPTT